MKKFIALSAEEFYPVPIGTILRNLGTDYNYDTKKYTIAMEILGTPNPMDEVSIPKVQFIN